jgi:GNAT superfamily N-acetyltransferase
MPHRDQATEALTDAAITIRLGRPDELALVTAIDDDASELFGAAGLSMAHLRADHPFVLDEQRRWAAAIDRRSLFVACGTDGVAVGFASLGSVDGDCHLDQLAVLRPWMRRGVGRALLGQAIDWARGRALWLTTYAHLPWNRPYYERMGFSVVPEALCGPDIRALLDDERNALPAPEQRVAMRTGA